VLAVGPCVGGPAPPYLAQRAEQQRVTREQRQQREERRAQEQADKEAEKRQREREKEFATILKLPSAEHESRLAALAKQSGEDLDFLRVEFSVLVDIEEKSGADPVEPWPDPVNTPTLLAEVMEQLTRYVVLHDDAAAVAMVLWIFFAWVHAEIAVHSTILLIKSAEADSGKTTLCGVLKFLTPRAHTSAELTGPALYRFVDHVTPTLYIDDADNLFKRKPDLTHIVNVSWTRGVLIYRTAEHGRMQAFSPFCAKAISGIHPDLPKATQSRCIDIQLLPKLPHEKADAFQHADDDVFVTLRRKPARWRDDNIATLKDAHPVSELNNRLRMNWHILLAVADIAGGKWPKRARAAAAKLSRERNEPSQGKRLLAAIRDLSTKIGPVLTSRQMVKLLRGDGDGDGEWANFRDRGPISSWQVSCGPMGSRPASFTPAVGSAIEVMTCAGLNLKLRFAITSEPPNPPLQVVRSYASEGRESVRAYG
jgi:Protein of unknown function (DUF3631)